MYCQKCLKEIDDDARFCPSCGTKIYIDDEEVKFVKPTNYESKSTPEVENGTLAICALVFGALGGILGLILGIVGLTKYQSSGYRAMCIVGIILSILWIPYIVQTFSSNNIVFR